MAVVIAYEVLHNGILCIYLMIIIHFNTLHSYFVDEKALMFGASSWIASTLERTSLDMFVLKFIFDKIISKMNAAFGSIHEGTGSIKDPKANQTHN